MLKMPSNSLPDADCNLPEMKTKSPSCPSGRVHMYANQSGILNDLTWPEVHEGPLCLCFAKIQVCNILSIFSLCLWRLILHLLGLGFDSLKGNLTQIRRAIASITIHSKGSIWDQFVFRMAKYHVFVHTLYFYYYFWRYSLLFPRNSYD